jgi:LPXTG-motif cell wall-anchored protein
METDFMRKLICLLISLALCAGLMLPALAAESRFIPSYGLEVIEASKGDEDVKDCLVVTSVSEAGDESTDISQEERDLLEDVYEALSEGTMILPLVGEYQFVELMDVRFALSACRDKNDHAHEESESALTVKFDMEIEAYNVLVAMTYADEKWEPVKNLADNGDGTITCQFEDICPVVFAVADKEKAPWNPSTGDAAGNHLMMVMGVMLLSAAGVVTLVGTKARKIR